MDEDKIKSATDDEDVKLMLAVKDGDDQAFEQLVLRHQKPLLNFFCRLGVNISDAEDLAQLRIYRYRATYERTAKFTTYLYLLARQVRIDEVRRQIKISKVKDAAKGVAEIFEASSNDKAQNSLQDDLQVALQSLDEPHREVVVLGMLRELPYQEVAEILKIPVGTVKSRMHHALKQLKKFLES